MSRPPARGAPCKGVVGQFETSVRPELVEGHFYGSTGSPRTETNPLPAKGLGYCWENSLVSGL